MEIDDDNTGIFHVFELQIGMNEFDHQLSSKKQYILMPVLEQLDLYWPKCKMDSNFPNFN